MEREVWIRGAMVVTIMGLVALILVTPGLLGRPPPDLESLPLLVIGMSSNDTFILSVGAAVQAYRYDTIRITVNASQPWNGSRVWTNETAFRNDTYGWEMWVPSNATFTVDTYLVDQGGNYFEYNVSARAEEEPSGRTAMVFTFPDEDNPSAEIRRRPPDDFRQEIPWRGTLA